MYQYTSNVHQITDWVNLPPITAAWTYGDWIEVLNPTPGTGIAITGAVPQPKPNVIDLPGHYEIEFGTNDPGDPVGTSVTAVGKVIGYAPTQSQYGPLEAFRRIGVPRVIANGLRLQIRMRKGIYFGGSEVDWPCAVGYYELPIVGNLLTTTKDQKALPDGSNGIIYDSAGLGVWADSPYQQIDAGLSSDIIITGMEFHGNITALFGATLALNTVKVSSISPTILVRIPGGTSAKGGPGNVDFHAPIGPIVAGTEIGYYGQVDISIGSSTQIGLKLSYIELPL